MSAYDSVSVSPGSSAREAMGPDAWLLRGLALPLEAELVAQVARIEATAPFRHLKTRGGFEMSVAMTNCGAYGWVSDRRGYRYEAVDPSTGRPWPPMPPVFQGLAAQAAAEAGFAAFVPDACLVNQYAPGARMALHQDRDERDFDAPIVSVSLGLPATFLWGAAKRADKPRRIPLAHGDVLVWGGGSRLNFHGVAPVRAGVHDRVGGRRLNLTFRRAR